MSLRSLLFSSLCGFCYAALPEAYVSSLDTTYQLSPYTAPVQGPGNNGAISSTWSLHVDDTPSGYKQKITGFGACVTDATVTTFNALNNNQRRALLNDLFSSNGISFSLMRHTIASSDLSSYAYSYDNVSTPDPSLKYFDLLQPGRAMAQLMKSMRNVNPSIKYLGSVWSPPGWMKLNGVMLGTTVNNNLNPAYEASYAQYFVEYLKSFAGLGVPIDAITLQNEPLNSNAGYPTMYLSAVNETNAIQNYVGPALRNASLNTEIWAYDHNTDVPSYPQTVLNGAGDYVNTVAWHCYAGNLSWGVLTDFHNANPNVTQYMTECWLSPFTSWYQSIYFTIGPLQNWASGAIAWTLGTSTMFGPHLPGGCNTCRGVIEVDVATGTYIKTNDYYFMGQFSKFVPRGATVLAGTGSYDEGSGAVITASSSGAAIESVAFMNADNTRTLVIYNGFGNDVYLTVTFSSGQTWSGPLYYYSVTTWLLPAGDYELSTSGPP